MSTPTTNEPQQTDVVVVGGGLAGLVAATDAARAGASVTLVEAREAGGGRARTDRVDGFAVNHGAHALYRAGAARAIVDDLGVPWAGHSPRLRGSGFLVDGRRVSALRLSPVGGLRGVRALTRAALRKGEPERYEGRTMGEWLADQPASARPMLRAAVRTATYQADLDGSAATPLLRQLQRAAKQVDYLDGGWQTLVEGLQKAAGAAGVRRVTAKVTAVAADGDRWLVDTAAGRFGAGAVVLALGGPVEADRLLGGASPAMARWAAVAEPVTATALEVLLHRRPLRRAGAYALDEPVYSVDAAMTCKVAPDGAALVHGLFYEPDRHPEADPRARLEAALDAWQPGWRDVVVQVIERKRMVVAHDRPRLAPAADLPEAVVPDLAGVYLASDAVTSEGLLGDAAASSGRRAGRAAADRAAVVRGSQPVPTA